MSDRAWPARSRAVRAAGALVDALAAARRTIKSYVLATDQVAAYARKHGLTTLDKGELIEDVLADMADRAAPATVAQRYGALQQFCKWLVAEGELDADPMAGMTPSTVPAQPLPVLSPDQLRALLKACEGRGWSMGRGRVVL